jgi:HEAT repeat protein
MGNATLNRLVELMRKGSPTVRRSAIIVAAELGSAQDGKLVQGLLSATRDEDPEVRQAAVAALRQLRAAAALPRLLELVRDGGPELESAAQSAASLGQRGARALEKLMQSLPTALRSRIVAALAHGDTDAAAVAAAHALLDEDPDVVSAAARSLASDVPHLPPGRRKALASYLLQKLEGKSGKGLTAVSEAGILRVLAALQDPRSEAVLWSRLAPRQPAAVRAAALQALGSLGRLQASKRLPLLLQCAVDPDFQVAAPALVLLQRVPVQTRHLSQWLQLFQASDVAIRKFAVEKLGHFEHPAVARMLAEQAQQPDRALREAALAALRDTVRGRQALLEALLEAPDAEAAWGLARAYAGEVPETLRDRVFQQACSYYDAEDRRAEALFHLLRQAAGAWFRERVEAKALALRRKRDYHAAVRYLKLLVRDPACSNATRFELAATGLKIADHDLSPEARQNEPSLAQFARLLHDPGFDLLGRLAKARFLEPADLFYLGFHFVEQQGHAREFGGKVLQLLIQRAPQSAVAKDAKRKLMRAGFDL